MRFKTGDKVRVTRSPFKPDLPNGVEGVVTDEEEGFFLYVSVDGYVDDYAGFLADEAHRGTWALTADEVELIESEVAA